MNLLIKLLVLLFFAFAPASGNAHLAPHNQSISIAPSEVGSGGIILVKGDKFEGLESVQIEIWDGSPSAEPERIGSTLADSEGNFHQNVSIPNNAAGIYIITVESASGLKATALIELLDVIKSEEPLPRYLLVAILAVFSAAILIARRRN